MLLITAADQTVATGIAAVINPHLLHYPLTGDEPTLNGLKFSFQRPYPQGSPRDRDMHGAQMALLPDPLEV